MDPWGELGIMPVALIIGITGQDGIYLAKMLLQKDYQVYGLSSNTRSIKAMKFHEMFPEVKLLEGNLKDQESLVAAIALSKPTEIYNLGGVSFVAQSLAEPEMTADITGLGAMRLFEAVRVLNLASSVKIYQASSSEMFGRTSIFPQNELTAFAPRNPYGVAKTFAHLSAINYRELYGLNISIGILYNHESEFRGYEYVTRKISSNVAKIKLGMQTKFSLGGLDSRRDWGFAGDYVEAMWNMTSNGFNDTFVISSGIDHSVREFLHLALKAAELEENVEKYVSYDASLIRPTEANTLVGDSRKAANLLKWKAKTSFGDLVSGMVEADLRIESSKS